MQPDASKANTPTGLLRYLGASALLFWLVVLAAITLLSISGLAQRKVKNVAPGQLTATATPHSTTESTLLFSIPVTESGILDAYNLTGFATGKDGAFWIGDGNNRILHYSSTGKRLGIINLDQTTQPLVDVQANSSELWILGGMEGFTYIRKLAEDGRVLSEFRLPEMIGDPPNAEPVEKGMRAILLAHDGAVILEKDFMTPYVQIVDPQGNLALKPLDGYPANGKLYKAAPDGPPIEHRSTGHIIAGDLNVTVTVSGTLAELKMLKVDPNQDFYVTAAEWYADWSDAHIVGERYILHYDSKGNLIGRARIPYLRLASAPDGTFFALDPKLNKQGVFDRVEIRRINFFGPNEPLPTPTITPVLPTATPEPPTDTPAPSQTPIHDLQTLAQQSDLIVRAKVEFTDGQTHTQFYSLLPQAWIKNPNKIIADKLSLWVLSGRDWGRTIPVVIDPVMISDTGPLTENRNKEYILFLHLANRPEWYGRPSYYLTDEYADEHGLKFSNAGVFSIHDNKIDFAGIPKYHDWAVQDFITEIHRYAPTPVPIPQPIQNLSFLGQKSSSIAEIEWLNRPPREVTALGGKRLLKMVQVVQWLKGDFQMQNMGLMLTQEEYNRLSTGSGHYILFFATVEGQTDCDYSHLRSYWPLQASPTGIFEVRDGKIAYSGIEGYTGYSLDQFKQSMRSAIPTPIPRPTSEGESIGGNPPTFADSVHEAQIIARVELEKQDATPNSRNSLPTTFKVINWLKKPPNYKGDTISVDVESIATCSFSLGKGPYIIFLRPDKGTSPDAAPADAYYTWYPSYLPLFGIRDGTIEYGTNYQYWAQPVEKLEADIRALLP